MISSNIQSRDYINSLTKEKLDIGILEGLKLNSMLKVNPHLFEIWDFEKNDELGLDIYKVAKSPKGKAWWYCPKCQDSYPQAISHKSNGTGCSICNGKYVTKVNCIATTNPIVANLLLNSEDGYKYTQFSDMKTDWKCNKCGNIIKNKAIKDISVKGLSCPICSDGTKFPEKVMYNLLKRLNVEFSHDTSMSFIRNRRYDFFLPDYNIIIETHGGQHYHQGFESVGGDTLDAVQENDIYKYETAMKNSIDKYIIIDCRNSEIEWIKNSILKSELSSIFDLNFIDWHEIEMASQGSNKIECLNMFLDGRRDYKGMANELKVDYATVNRWLNFWKDVGRCEYIPLDTSKEIVQLDMNNNFIESWSSIGKARKYYKNVSKVLNNERSNDQGYRFMYKEDYDRLLKGENSHTFYENKKITKQVIQLSIGNEFIREWNSMTEAARSLGKNNGSGIGAVCQGRMNKHAGFKWMYKDDYEELLKVNSI